MNFSENCACRDVPVPIWLPMLSAMVWPTRPKLALTAQLADWADVDLRTGMRVELVIGQIKRDADGTVVTGPKFRPVEGSPA